MGNEEFEQAAKQNRWGSLAARLEVQCEDVLSVVTAGKGGNGGNGGGGGGGGDQFSSTSASGGGGGALMNGTNPVELLRRQSSGQMNGGDGSNTSSLSTVATSIGGGGGGAMDPNSNKNNNDNNNNDNDSNNNNNNNNRNNDNINMGVDLSASLHHHSLHSDVGSVHSAGGSMMSMSALSANHPSPPPLTLISPPVVANDISSSNAALETKATRLKDWIATKKIDREIREATPLTPAARGRRGAPSAASDRHRKAHVERCVKISLLLVAKLAHGFEQATSADDNANGNDGNGMGLEEEETWEPKPRDVDEDCITVTEYVATGDIADVEFDIYRNFDWDRDPDADEDLLDGGHDRSKRSETRRKLAFLFGALGKLLYRLFMDGEDVPSGGKDGNDGGTTAARRSSSGAAAIGGDCGPGASAGARASNGILDEDDIMDMLRNLPPSRGAGEEDDRVAASMRDAGHLPAPLRRLVADVLHTSAAMMLPDASSGSDRIAGFGRLGSGSSRDGADASRRFGSLSDVRDDVRQMVDFPDAFLFASINSRWELVFGNNHMFGRKTELRMLMDAARRVEGPDAASEGTGPGVARRKKGVVLVDGHAGSGKSRLVHEIRKPLRARGWLFLRCKFGKTARNEPLSVVALGLDEYFSSNVSCRLDSGQTGGGGGTCSCGNGECPRRVCERLEVLIGLDGLKCLSQQMPGLRNLIGDMYAHRRDSLNNINGGLQGKFHTHHLFGTLLDTLASFNPVLFFVDDLQWADAASLELLTGLINRVVTNYDGDSSSTNRILFVGAYRTDNIVEGPKLKSMIQEFESCDAINTTLISLRGIQLESLNEMVSEALCLPRRKTRSLAEMIHLKTQGFPLFVVEFLDALWTEKLLVHNPADGWEWDVDAIDLKAISKSVAELLTCKLWTLPRDVLSGIQVLSCFGSHVDASILEAIKNYDGTSGASLAPALDMARSEGLVEKAGPTYTFSHDLIQRAAFDLVPIPNRVPLLQKLVSCLIPRCMLEVGGSDPFLYVAVDLINRIGSDAVSDNPTQSQLFARLNLEAGKKFMAAADFSSAARHFKSGISFLQSNYWKNEYDLSLNLFENLVLANYSEGNHEEVVNHVNHVLSNAGSFEDKFKSYCVFVNVMAIDSVRRATEKLYDLLRALGENIDPNQKNPQVVLNEFLSTRALLSSCPKDVFLNLDPMTDRTKLMTMKLLAMLVRCHHRQMSLMSGYLVCKMIQVSLQYGHCEDTVFALSVFSAAVTNNLHDIDEGCALARIALSLSKLYDPNRVVPRVYEAIYGHVLVAKEPIQSTLDPLLRACRLSFSNGNFEHTTFNTSLYIARTLSAGKKIPLIVNELNAFTHQHKQQSHLNILQLFLAPCYKFMSALSGISLDSSELLPQLAATFGEDNYEAARAKSEHLYVRAAVSVSLLEPFYMRNFAQASQVILNNPEIFELLAQPKQLRITHFGASFIAGLTSLHMARQTREAHWMDKGTNVTATFENWSKINEWNFEQQYLILKAELHHTKGETSAAAQAYNLAAESAQKHCFVHHVALACELAAHFFGNIGAKEKTREMIQRSHDAYMEWGAARKAKAVINLLELQWLDGS